MELNRFNPYAIIVIIVFAPILFYTGFTIQQTALISILLVLIMSVYNYLRYQYLRQLPYNNVSERFQIQCNNCVNRYVIPQLAQIHDPRYIEKQVQQPKIVEIQPIAAIPLTPKQSQEFKQVRERESRQPPQPPQQVNVQQPQKIAIQPVQPQEKVNVCQALNRAGFDPHWNLETVNQILQTQEGRQRLEKINSDVLSMTNLQSLTNQEIVNCYPNYISEYICQRPSQTQNQQKSNELQQLKKKLQEQQNQINSLSQIMMDVDPNAIQNRTVSRRQTDDITDIGLENQIMNTTAIPTTAIPTTTLPTTTVGPAIANTTTTMTTNGATTSNISTNPNCNLITIGNEINSQVEKYYQSAYNILSKQNPPLPVAQLQQIKSQYDHLQNIIQNKALLELKQLINLYNNKTNNQWKNDLVTRKTYSVRGHLVPGTDFYIPWSIFDKHVNCFGKINQ